MSTGGSCSSWWAARLQEIRAFSHKGFRAIFTPNRVRPKLWIWHCPELWQAIMLIHEGSLDDVDVRFLLGVYAA